MRTTTRIAHVKGQVSPGEKTVSSAKAEIVKDAAKFVMLPANARSRRKFVTERMKKLSEFAETFPENSIEWGDGTRGFITRWMNFS